MQNKLDRIVVLGTGGTIAGESSSPDDDLGYVAGTLSIDTLLARAMRDVALTGESSVAFETEQVAQLDSKDMDFATWRLLAQRVAHHLQRGDVRGIVITHGSDTLEETAYFLQRVLEPAKPVALTAAMRPATSRESDGPRNLLDSIAVACDGAVAGVMVVVAGAVHLAIDVRKSHSHRLDAFTSGDAGACGRVEDGRFIPERGDAFPKLLEVDSRLAGEAKPIGVAALPEDVSRWPAVEIVSSHAGASARQVDALLAVGTRGIVVAATGNGTVHHRLEAALRDAQRRGLRVLRSTRCLDGGIADPYPRPADDLPSAGHLTPVKARVELMLQLLAGDASARRP